MNQEREKHADMLPAVFYTFPKPGPCATFRIPGFRRGGGSPCSWTVPSLAVIMDHYHWTLSWTIIRRWPLWM